MRCLFLWLSRSIPISLRIWIGKTVKKITKLKLGSTREEVLALLGSPDITEAKRQGATAIQVMFFRTQHVRADGLTTQDECTPLLFENDKLIAWGEGAYSSYQKS